MGVNGPSEIKMHPWFKDFDWSYFNSQSYDSPFADIIESDSTKGGINYEELGRERDWKNQDKVNIEECEEYLNEDVF